MILKLMLMRKLETLHPANLISDKGKKLDAEEMSQGEPPDERFDFLSPPRTKGYNLRRKKWFELSVDRISDVVWNGEAFQRFVIECSAKDMIQALVTNQLESEKSTDLTAGKGNGLILLLHGGPETGKTLTAESVAETAEKPLYCVTCGGVGIKAEDVEKYLESVLSVNVTCFATKKMLVGYVGPISLHQQQFPAQSSGQSVHSGRRRQARSS